VPHESFVTLLAAARNADRAAQGALLLPFGNWLKLLATVQLEDKLQSKLDPSDILQQAYLSACRDLPNFRGQTREELAGWLRQILVHTLAHEVRRYRGSQQRDVDLEVSLQERINDSSRRLGEILADTATSPSELACRHEHEAQLAEVLGRLPEDYRRVIVLRHLEALSHEEVAQRMGRSASAVRMLWMRALAQLKVEVEKAGSRSPAAPG